MTSAVLQAFVLLYCENGSSQLGAIGEKNVANSYSQAVSNWFTAAACSIMQRFHVQWALYMIHRESWWSDENNNHHFHLNEHWWLSYSSSSNCFWQSLIAPEDTGQSRHYSEWILTLFNSFVWCDQIIKIHSETSNNLNMRLNWRALIILEGFGWR